MTLRADVGQARITADVETLPFQASGNARLRFVADKLRERVSVEDYRFAPDLDDTASLERALAVARVVDLADKQYRVSSVRVPSFRLIRGAGKSPWEPYTGEDKPVGYLTEIVVDGTDAFDCRNTNSVTIQGLAVASVEGTQSPYRSEPGYQSGSGGIAITGSSQFQARDISFFGLEYAVHSHLHTASLPGGETVSGVETDEAFASANATQMPSITDWQASDCKRVFQFGNNTSAAYTSRDVQISNEKVALHCGRIIEAHWCDGLRVENVRFYQCTEHSIYARKCVFLTLVGATIFETGLDAVSLHECENTTMAGVQVARTGFYQTPTGTPEAPIYAQRAAIRLDRCITTQVSGLIEKPTGFSVDADQCTTTVLDVACDTPFWLTGNATNLSGAIDLRQCDYTTINAAIGGANHQIAVWADPRSARTLGGAITGNPVGGVVRAVHLQQQGGYTYRVRTAQEVVNEGVWQFDTLRVFVPENKRLVTRSVEITIDGFALRANAQTWNAETLPEPGGGSIAFDDKELAPAAATDRYVDVPLAIVNLSGETLTVPVGVEVRVSMAFVDDN
jgi:hypothetical protein